jgi:RNA polymerase sigma-B factor
MTTAPTRTRHPRIDAPDTDEAFRRLAALAEGPERDRLREDIVCDWLPMANRLAARFRNRGETMEDLRQVAAVGLVKAVDRFDPFRGKAFATYAVPTVVGEIKRHFRDHTWDLHVPRRVQDLRSRVRVARQELLQTCAGRAPTTAQIAEEACLSLQDTLLGLEALESYCALSLDAELAGADDGYTLGSTLGAADPAFDLLIDREAVKPGLGRLPRREQSILYMRFFDDMTQGSIAEELGISQMHVSRLISRCCEQLRLQALQDVRGQGTIKESHAHSE